MGVIAAGEKLIIGNPKPKGEKKRNIFRSGWWWLPAEDEIFPGTMAVGVGKEGGRGRGGE